MRHALLAFTIFLAGALPAAAGVSAEQLEAALAYLPSYEQGMDRLPLTHIEYALADAQSDAERLSRFETLFVQVLNDAEAKLDSKRFIMRRLAVFGSAASVPAVAAHLDTEGLSDYAVRVLEAYPFSEAAQALRDALGAGRGPADSLVRALGEKADGDSIALLEQRLAEQLAAGDGAAAHTATALSANSTAACDMLIKRFQKGSEAVRGMLGDGCLQCAEHRAQQGEKEAAIQAYEAIWMNSVNPALLAATLQGLAELHPAMVQEEALKALRGGNEAMKLAALGALRRTDNSSLDIPENASLPLLVIYAETGSGAAIEAIRSIAADESAPEHVAALEALGRFGDARDVPTLLAAASSSIALRRAVAPALAILPGGDETDAALLEAAVDGPYTREALAGLESRRAAGQAAGVLERIALADHDGRQDALNTLSVVGGPTEAAALLEAMATEADQAIRKRMGQAIAAIIIRNEDDALTDETLERAGKKGPAQAEYVEIVGELAPEGGVDVLAHAAKSRDEAVQAAAYRALANWPNVDALDSLEGMARRRSGGELRAVAYDGYIRLIRASALSPEERVERYRKSLRFNPTLANKRQLVSAVGETVTLDALKLAVALRSDSDVQAEAAVAVIGLSRALAGAYPEAAREQLETYLDRPEDDNLRVQATEALAFMDGFGDYLVGWQVAGPYHEQGKGGGDLFEMTHAPEMADGLVSWRVLPAPTRPERPAWYIDLFNHLGGFERVAYVRNEVYSPEAQSARLELGSDDGIKAWVNGELVHQRMVLRTAEPGNDLAEIQLKEGWNTVMLGVYQLGSDWGAVARIAAPDGSALEGLQVRLP